MATFVYDRTAEDVAALNEKGTYNKDDMNRVQNACDEIAAELNAAGIPVTLTAWPRATWARTHIPTADDFAIYLGNVALIKAALPNNAPDVPASMAYLTYEKANDIERILYEIETLLKNMLSIFPRCGAWPSNGIIYEVTI